MSEAAPQFEGEFETHLTVAGERGELDGEGLLRFAQAHGLKCLQIELARGVHAFQPMLTRRGHGDLAGELAIAARVAAQLRDAGFVVCRTKIEASPTNAGIPQHEHEAQPGRYFESHIKLLLAARADSGELAALAIAHGAHLSRNALRWRDDGRHERFVTQRYARGGFRAVDAALRNLLDALRPLGHRQLSVETEYVVHDSNLAIDDGWIVPAATLAGSPAPALDANDTTRIMR